MFFSIVIATHNRTKFLETCLESVFKQEFKDFEIIIAHSGMEDGTRDLIQKLDQKKIQYLKCQERGAATQRNEGISKAKGEWILFLDDDVVLHDGFLSAFQETIKRFPQIGGVSGRIENQYFQPPGVISRFLLRLIGIRDFTNLAGNIAGPALNFLPEREGAEFEEIKWMPTCICGYKAQLLKETGGFASIFKDYSFAEDLHLSLKISKQNPLMLCRKAVLFHNDEGSRSHVDYAQLAEMQVRNRLFIIQDLNIMPLNVAVRKIRRWHLSTFTVMLLRGRVSVQDWWQYVKGIRTAIKKYR